MSVKFLRTDLRRYLRLGKKRRKLQVWRRAKGVHSKIRRKRAGYPRKPEVGYRTQRTVAGLIDGLRPVVVHNLAELSKLTKLNAAILAKVGAKKKLEMIKKAQEMNVRILNVRNKK